MRRHMSFIFLILTYGFVLSTPTSPLHATCICVPYYLCTDDQKLLTDGRGIIGIRSDGDTNCENVRDWCCSPTNVITKNVLPVDNVKLGCGWRNSDGVGFRNLGDDSESKFGEFPWMVVILYTEDFVQKTSLSYQCGGSLIHPQAVITAAHCVNSREKKYIIRAGEWDSQKTQELYPHADRHVKATFIHPDYNQGALYNDIAFLLLDSTFNMTYPNIGLACLPPQGVEIPSGTGCFATGWGKERYGKGGMYQVILKKINLPIVKRSTCEANLQKTRLGSTFTLDRSFICAGGKSGIDMCSGDGGSPLVCPIPGKVGHFQQTGIVSWGIGCGGKDIPGLYANVAHFRTWIDQQATKNNLDISTYAF